jgi:hypothetical protein
VRRLVSQRTETHNADKQRNDKTTEQNQTEPNEAE